MEGEGKGWVEMILLLPPPPSTRPLVLVLALAPLSLWLQLPGLAEGLEPEVEPTAGRFELEKKKKKKRSVEQLSQLIWAVRLAEIYP